MACTACKVSPCTCPEGGYTEVTKASLTSTLISSLTCVVDATRDLYTSLGARNYRVALIWTRWSGGERGRGVEVVALEEAILPTPNVSDLKTVRIEVEQVGSLEQGEVTVSQISPRYTEAELLGLSRFTIPGDQLPEDMNFYWEIFYPGTDGDGVRRRFTPKSAPNSNPTKFEWAIRLVRQSEDRTTSGEIR